MKLVTFARMLAAAVLLGVLSGCTGESEPREQIPIAPPEPASGPELVAEEPKAEEIERAVSLNPSVTEVLFDLGLGERLYGVSDYCAYPDEAAALPRCGSELTPALDAILETDAQAVLSLSPLPTGAITALEDAGVGCYVFDKPDTLEALPGYYAQLAETLLGPDEGGALAESFSRPLIRLRREVGEAAAALDARPSGAFAALLPLTLATGDTMQGELLTLCGIDNVADEFTDWQYPQELLLPLDPEVLVVDTRTVTAEQVRGHVNYKTTSCVKQERILELDGSAVENGGMRLYQAMLDLARFAGAGGLPEKPEFTEEEDA